MSEENPPPGRQRCPRAPPEGKLLVMFILWALQRPDPWSLGTRGAAGASAEAAHSSRPTGSGTGLSKQSATALAQRARVTGHPSARLCKSFPSSYVTVVSM